MISVYDRDEVDFSHNGIILLDVTSCIVEEELNGKYILELEHPIDKKDKWKNLVEENIIKADGQLFRIYSTEKELNYIYVFARHIFYDLLHNFLEDVRPTEMNGAAALNWILSNTQYPHRFRGTSDIETINTQYYIRKNPVEAILGEDSLVTRWNGELERDNFTIKLLNQRGQDKGVQISYGKNLLGLEVKRDMDTVITRLMPIGRDGLLLPEKYIDSDLIDNYAYPYIKKVNFDIGEEEPTEESEGVTKEEAIIKLREKAIEYMEKSKCDIPEINIKVNLLLLENTKEYEHLKNLIRVNLGDIVSCSDNPLNIKFNSKVIRVKKDILENKNIEVELGQTRKGISNIIGDAIRDISEDMQNRTSSLEKAITNATERLTSALGGHVVKRAGELLIMDSEDIETAKRVWRWNLNGLGYSKNGINGPYELAMTIDGEIVADFITTGTLDAGIVKTGILSSKDNTSWINLDTGTFNLLDRIKYDGNIFDIDISNTALDEEITNIGIKADTANKELEAKVSVDELGSLIQQHPDNVRIAFGKLGGENMLPNGSFIGRLRGYKAYNPNSTILLNKLEDDNSYIEISPPKVDEYYGYIMVARNLGIIYEEFIDINYATRAEVAWSLYQIYDGDEEPADRAFSDYEPREFGYYETMVLVSAGIITGYPNGTFKPSNNIRRDEMARLVVSTLGLDDEAKNFVGDLPFIDVSKSHWAYGYIGVVYTRGLMEGETETIFNPQGNLEGRDVLKLIVKIVGREGEAEQINDNPKILHYGIMLPKIQIAEPGEYTLSFDFNPKGKTNILDFMWIDLDGDLRPIEDINIIPDRIGFKRYRVTFYCGDTREYARVILGKKYYGEDDDGFQVRKIQIEEGPNATAFAPSPHEIEAKDVIIDNSGITIRNGALTIKDKYNTNIITANGLKIRYVFISSGELNGWQKIGLWDDGGMIAKYSAFINVSIPEALIIESAVLRAKSMPRYFTGWGTAIPDGFYHGRNLKLYKVNTAGDGFIDYPAYSQYAVYIGDSGKTDITNSVWGINNWSPSGRGIKSIEGNAGDYLNEGETIFLVETTDRLATENERYGGGMQFELIVTGYLRG